MGLISRVLMFFKVKTSSAIDRMEDPRQLLDYAYQQQQYLLLKTKQALVEVATSKARLEQESKKLLDRIPQTEDQARRALTAGREDLARITLHRKQTALAEIQVLDVQILDVAADEVRLTQTEQELSARIEEFRTHRGVIAARYTAAQAQVRATEALTGLSGEFAELSMALGRAVEKTEQMQARATAIGALFDAGSINVLVEVTDPVERELLQETAERVVEEELAALKAGPDSEASPPALSEECDDEAADTPDNQA